MSSRQFIVLSIVTTILVAGGLVVALAIANLPARAVLTTNPLKGRAEMVDRLAMFDSTEEFEQGRLEHTTIARNRPERIVLDDKRDNTFPRYGYWTSPEVQTEFGFTELIPSWNATTPPNTGVRFQLRVRDARSGKWSPWLYFGQWGRTIIPRAQDRPIHSFEYGVVGVDNLLLDRPANAYQVRACLQSFEFDRNINPSIRRISVAYSGPVKDERERARLIEPIPAANGWARDLKVPFRAQKDTPKPLQNQSCSPTAVTMLMAHWGVDRPIAENAAAIYDGERDIFGNWNRAVQRAADFGLDAWVTRFRNWDQVRHLIASGQPVIATINFQNEAEFPSALYDKTDGHLIVIRGFKPNGDVIVNDPASKEKGNGVVYKSDELGRAWFANAGGVAYIIRGSNAAVAAREPSPQE